jgi:hypothetical protein
MARDAVFRAAVSLETDRWIAASIPRGFANLFRNGAPRPTKMGTIVLPWHYDAVACHAIRPDNQRRTAILRYASWALFLPISPGGPVTLR